MTKVIEIEVHTNNMRVINKALRQIIADNTIIRVDILKWTCSFETIQKMWKKLHNAGVILKYDIN